MARTDTLGHFLTDVADAIRTKTGDENLITASDFDTAISNIPSGGNISDYYTGSITSGSNTSTGILQSIKKVPAMTFNGSSTAYMFAKMQQATEIDCSLFTTNNTTTMNNMFHNCYALTSLDLSSFNTSNVTNMSNMFYGCVALQTLDIRNFTFDSVTAGYTNMLTGVPNDCLIIVKSNTEKTYVTTNFPNLTNVKTVEEYEAL